VKKNIVTVNTATSASFSGSDAPRHPWSTATAPTC